MLALCQSWMASGNHGHVIPLVNRIDRISSPCIYFYPYWGIKASPFLKLAFLNLPFPVSRSLALLWLRLWPLDTNTVFAVNYIHSELFTRAISYYSTFKIHPFLSPNMLNSISSCTIVFIFCLSPPLLLLSNLIAHLPIVLPDLVV